MSFLPCFPSLPPLPPFPRTCLLLRLPPSSLEMSETACACGLGAVGNFSATPVPCTRKVQPSPASSSSAASTSMFFASGTCPPPRFLPLCASTRRVDFYLATSCLASCLSGHSSTVLPAESCPHQPTEPPFLQTFLYKIGMTCMVKKTSFPSVEHFTF